MSADRLVAAVAERLRRARVFRTAAWATVIAAAVLALATAALRLSGWWPDPTGPAWLLLPPLAALAAALAVVRRVPALAAARHADRAAGLDDLLTSAHLLRASAEGYAPLLRDQADARAATLAPARLAPLGGRRPALIAGAALLVTSALVLWLPRCDPFGRQAVAQRIEARRAELRAEAEQAKAQAQELARLRQDATAPGDQLQEQLAAELARAGERGIAPDPQVLARLGAGIAAELRRLGPDTDATSGAQRLGGATLDQTLADSEQRAARDDVRRAVAAAQRAADAGDPAERARAERELRSAVQRFSAAAGRDPAAAQAVQRMLDQLAAADNPQLTPEALQALEASLTLAEAQLGQGKSDAAARQALRDALRTLDLARRAGALAGTAAMAEARGASDTRAALQRYRERYEQLLAQAGADGEGDGKGGMGGKGRGEGGSAQENNAATSDFTDERAASQLSAGRMLMEWRGDGPSQRGEAKATYDRALQQVREGVTEALAREQVPADYHDAVKSYFDRTAPPAP